MDTKEFCVYNKTRENFLSSGVTVIDSVSDPLQVLKVLIEGLADNAETGMWLTPLRRVPVVPRISPFDLVYLDEDRRVLHGVEVLPSAYFSPFDGPADSALLLPIHTLSSSQTHPGDQFVIYEAEPLPQPAAEENAQTELDSTPLSLEPADAALQLESAPPLVQAVAAPAQAPPSPVQFVTETHAIRPHALPAREPEPAARTFAEVFSQSDVYDPSTLVPHQTDVPRVAKRVKDQAIARTGSSLTMRYLRFADRFVYGPTRKLNAKGAASSTRLIMASISAKIGSLAARYLRWADSIVYGQSLFQYPKPRPQRRISSSPRAEKYGD